MVQHLSITNTNRNYVYYKLKNINKQLTLGVLLRIKILRNTHDAPKPRNHISLQKITPETTQLNQKQNTKLDKAHRENHSPFLSSRGSWTPMSPSKLEAGPGSPCWEEKESRKLFTRFTSTSTGLKSSSISEIHIC